MLLNTPGWGRMRKNDITPQVHSDNEISHRKRCWLPSIDQQKNVTTLRTSSLYELDKETVQLAINTFTPNCKLNILFPFPGYSFLEQSTYVCYVLHRWYFPILKSRNNAKSLNFEHYFAQTSSRYKKKCVRKHKSAKLQR